jgi:hypothetical protein
VRRFRWALRAAGLLSAFAVTDFALAFLPGPEWIIRIAQVAFALGWVALAVFAVHWLDARDQERSERRWLEIKRQEEAWKGAERDDQVDDPQTQAFWIAKAESDARRALDAGMRPDDV